MQETVSPAVPEMHPKLRRTLLAGMAGNVMEWYDFGLYGYFAPIIAKLFFPSHDSLASLISTFGVFAAGFLMRPVGAAIFGHFGDRIGRQKALAASVILMAVPTGLVGVLPTYAQLGVIAPLLLTILRLLQGVSVGGEFTGSMTFLVEHAPPGRRGFMGSCTVFSCVCGILLGSGVGALLTTAFPKEVLEAWAWRLPFLLGTVVGGVGLYLRTGIPESEDFKKLEAAGQVAKSPVLDAIRHNWREMLTVVGLNVLQAVAFYMVFVYMTTYLSTVIKTSLRDALVINTISMIVLAALIPTMGKLSDRIGRKPLMFLCAGGFFLFSYPLFMVINDAGFLWKLLAQCVFAVMLSGFFGPCAATFVELFPARLRYSGLSLSYNLTLAIFGGATPLISTFLIKHTLDPISPAAYLTGAAVVTLLTICMIRETSREPLQ